MNIKISGKSASLLSGLAVIGLATTVVLTIRSTIKATKHVETLSKDQTKKDIVKETAFYYISPVLSGAATVVCILGANALNKKQQASLISAYALLDQYIHNYRRTLVDMYGEETDKEVQAAMSREICDYHQIDIDYPDQKVIWYDPISEQSIERYEREIMDAEYHLNRNFVMRGYARLNELYYFLGMPPTNYGNDAGWCINDGILWVDFEHHLIEEDDGGTPIYEICMVFYPEILNWMDC